MSDGVKGDVAPRLCSQQRQRRIWIWSATCFFVLVAAVSYVLMLGQGPVGLSPGRVLEILNGGGSRSEIRVVWDLRMPVALATLIVGAALGLAGSWTQSMSRNPLASPDILGVTGGASVMVAAPRRGCLRDLVARGARAAGSGVSGHPAGGAWWARHEQPHRHRRYRAIAAVSSHGGVSLARCGAPPCSTIPAVAGGNARPPTPSPVVSCAAGAALLSACAVVAGALPMDAPVGAVSSVIGGTALVIVVWNAARRKG